MDKSCSGACSSWCPPTCSQLFAAVATCGKTECDSEDFVYWSNFAAVLQVHTGNLCFIVFCLQNGSDV